MLATDEHVQIISIEERKVVAEPTKVLEDIPLDESNLEKYTRVGASMESKEGGNIYLPPISQIPYRVRDRASARRLVSCKRVLFGHVSYG